MVVTVTNDKIYHNENEMDFEIFKLCVSPVCSAQHKESLYHIEIVTWPALVAASFHSSFRKGNLKVRDTEYFFLLLS